jgi:hypothetical protein
MFTATSHGSWPRLKSRIAFAGSGSDGSEEARVCDDRRPPEYAGQKRRNRIRVIAIGANDEAGGVHIALSSQVQHIIDGVVKEEGRDRCVVDHL